MKRVQHVSLHPHRLKTNPEEKAFAMAWKAHNRDGSTLAHLLGDVSFLTKPPEPSQRDATVAATVVQWLGSPVGEAFLRDLGYEKARAKAAVKLPPPNPPRSTPPPPPPKHPRPVVGDKVRISSHAGSDAFVVKVVRVTARFFWTSDKRKWFIPPRGTDVFHESGMQWPHIRYCRLEQA